MTAPERRRVDELRSVQLRPGAVRIQLASLGLLAITVALARYVNLPMRPDLYWLMGALSPSLVAALAMLMRGNARQFNYSGLMHGVGIALAYRFLTDALPNPGFWLIPLAMLITFTTAVFFTHFWNHLFFNVVCWAILTNGGTVSSGVHEQQPLVTLLILAGMGLASVVCLVSDGALRRNLLLTVRLEQLADFDALTELRNRRSFLQIVESVIHKRAKRAQRAKGPEGGALPPLYFALLDIDDFKRINDTLGHGVGDLALQETAAAIRTYCGQHPCGRLGGEEFGILLYDLEAEAVHTFMDGLVPHLAEAAVRGPRITASVGLARLRDGDHLNDLVQRADQQLYHAKRSGKNRWQGQA
ncbi:diguanylate cyclase [Paracidovorax wautersii]|uniref:GGDEF domain-containing protein n=1 Tax=Paracidovorax wautersii TaxID=1177982 RepID=UPI0031DD242E